MLSNIPCLIPDTGNGRLTEPLPLSKLEPSFFRCELTVDGFTSKFFEPYRDIVGLGIVEAPMAFFQWAGIPTGSWMHTFDPCVEDPQSCDICRLQPP